MKKREGKVSLKMSLKTMLKEFAGSTTAHGVSRLPGSRNWFIRVIWLALLAGAWTMIVLQVSSLFDKYNSYPVNTKVEIVNSQLEFPSVTVCNHNSVKFSKLVRDRPLRDFLYSVIKYIEDQKYELPIYDDIPAYSATNGPLDEDSYTTTSRPTSPATENPQTYNGSLWGDVPEESDYFADENSFKGYDPVFKADSEFKLRVSALTKEQMSLYSLNPYIPGLRLILNIRLDEYVPLVSPAAGVRVAVHKFGTKAYPYDSGFSVEPGKETSVSLKSEHIKRLPYPWGDCDPNGAFSSFVGCMRECLERSIEEACRCTRKPGGFKSVCHSTFELRCVERTVKMLESDGGQIICRSCNKPCTETVFRKFVSSSKWPARKYEPYIRDEVNRIVKTWTSSNWTLPFYRDTVDAQQLNSNEDSRENLLRLNVFYGELHYQNITEQKAYQLEQFASDIGGQLGLWAGVSVLTIAELIELILLLVQTVANRMHSGHRAAAVDSQLDRGRNDGEVIPIKTI